ncbi:MAG: hypothetical protein EP329_03220 [Deltaproteobacteria bacterium]|nr:MAG: hypothetical protein EP329_03220 [Deltaproteobacteria bacterium]
MPEPITGLAGWSQAVPWVVELLAPERLEALGVGFPTSVVAYGGPVWPVLRLTLADPGRTRARLDEVFAGVPLGVREEVAPGVPTWLFTVDATRMRVGVVDDQLVLAAWPATLDGVSSAAFVAPADGDPMPAVRAFEAALEKTGGRRDLAVGWMRTAQLARAGLGYYLAAYASDEAGESEAFAACRREMEQLLGGLPDLLFGYQGWSPGASSFAVVADLADPELAGAIAAVGDGGVGLAVEPYPEPGVVLSVSLDVAKVGDLLGLLARRMASGSYACDEVREIGESLASTSMQIGLSGRLLLGGFHALHVRLVVAEGGDPMDMMSGSMVAVAVHDNPEQLVSLLRSFGQIDLELPPDGETRALGEGQGLVLGRSGRLTGIGYGANAEADLARTLAGGPGGPAPLLAYGVDGGFGDDVLGILERVDAALEASTSFPDGARVTGEVARIGEASVDASVAYQRASALEASGWDLTPDALLGAAIDQLVERELALAALRRLREPTLAERGAWDDARSLVRRRLERVGKLRFSKGTIARRYRSLVARELTAAPLDEALSLEIAHELAQEAVTAETERLVAAQRRRTPVVDTRAAAMEQVTGHWKAVWVLRDTLEKRLAAAARERVEVTLRVRDGLVEVLGATRKKM